MTFSWNKIATLALLALATAVSTTNAQIEYLDPADITQLWSQFATDGIDKGNGVFLSPSGDLAVVVSRNGAVSAFNPATGVPVWSFPTPSATSNSTSGAFFVSGASPYIAYCVKTGGSSSVITLNPSTGAQIIATGAVEGDCVGTPVTTKDGKYILITYNVGGATGYFSVFDTTSPTEPVYTYTMSNGTEPFGAIGYYWGPGEGYFPGGETNTNDVFIWALDNNLQNETVGVGQVFAFQLPEFNVTLVGGERLWQSPLPPIITNGGISMYWAVSRSEQRCWNGEPGLARFDFTQGGETVTFGRGFPRSAAALAPPTISSDAAEPFVVGPTASNQLFRLPFDYSGTPVTTATNGVVSSRVLISKDDLYVYYATPNPDNTLYQLDAATFDVIWNITFPNGISGDIAQSLNGDTIFVADIVGSVYAYKVANAPVANITQAPTNPPVATPAPAPTSVNGTMSPAPSTMTNGTMMPGTMDPNPNGTMAPMSLVSNETKAPNTPVSKPAAAPAKAPVAAPVKAPVAGPAATPAATPAAGPVAVPSKPVSPPVKAPAAAPTSSAGAAAVGAILSSALLIAVLAVGMV